MEGNGKQVLGNLAVAGETACIANPSRHKEAVQMRERIRGWLLEEEWTVRQETVPDADWALVADNGIGVKVNVRQPLGRSGVAQLLGSIALDEDGQGKLMTMKPEERKDLLWDLRFLLLGLGVDFGGLDEVPTRIVVALQIYEDGLTKDSFLRRIGQVNNATLAVVWSFARKFSQPPPERTMGLVPER
jgi:hypothetical protein